MKERIFWSETKVRKRVREEVREPLTSEGDLGSPVCASGSVDDDAGVIAGML